MSGVKMQSELALDLLKELAAVHTAYPTETHPTTKEDRVVPADLRRWLARLRLLYGVPFAYLVSDSELLPPESARFFYLDRNWTDALVQGALSVGTLNSVDRAQLEQLHKIIRKEVDEEEREIRQLRGDPVQRGEAGVVTGLLLRSRAVSGWPGLHVRAYGRDVVGDEEVVGEDHPDRLKVLRMERLAPAVLLVLFDGVPRLVHVEEPRQGLQFGVRLKRDGNSDRFVATVRARDRNTSADAEPDKSMKVFFRRGSPGVLDLKKTAEEFIGTAQTNTGPDLDGAEFALQMIRFPFRQVFGRLPDPVPLRAVFRPTIGHALTDLEISFQENLP
mgnify:CR=1 FL=1